MSKYTKVSANIQQMNFEDQARIISEISSKLHLETNGNNGTIVTLKSENPDGEPFELSKQFNWYIHPSFINRALADKDPGVLKSTLNGNQRFFNLIMDQVIAEHIEKCGPDLIEKMFSEELERIYAPSDKHHYVTYVDDIPTWVLDDLSNILTNGKVIGEGLMEMYEFVAKETEDSRQLFVFPVHWKHMKSCVPIASIVEHNL